MILYRSLLPNYYYLVSVVGGWLSQKWENLEKISGFYRSTTIRSYESFAFLYKARQPTWNRDGGRRFQEPSLPQRYWTRTQLN